MAQSHASPLSIAVVGVGNIGSAFAYHLAKAGHDVTVVARPASRRLSQLQRDRGIVMNTGERAETQVADRLDEEIPYDLVLVTVLAHQIDPLIAPLQRSRSRCIHLMFNTFAPERLLDQVGAQRCSFGMPFVMAAMDFEGRLNLTLSSARKTLHGEKRWVNLFVEAGIPSALEADMPRWLRSQVPFCIAMESISVLAQRRGSGASWRESAAVARGLHAGFTILAGLGERPYPTGKAVLNATPAFAVAGMLWALSRVASFRELLATGKNECRALIDDVVSAASNGRSVPQSAVAALLQIRPGD